MAVVKTSQSAKLIIKVQTKTNAKGEPVYAQRSFNGLNPAAADSEVYAIGTAIAALQKNPVEAVSRQDVAALAEQ
ncbi:DUF1659 domain-containing protein [Anaerosinus massiliensis]|uniref:DUF1659 domain-containing protein n=1 Tax=Massilibacillus massiliensis TaxID=1806837 RepID=UPI000DA5FA32|nr:DUF1659 domain-containing protein [Massilibacillus massiliensis]